MFKYIWLIIEGPPHMVTLVEIQKLYGMLSLKFDVWCEKLSSYLCNKGSRCKIEQIDNRVLHYQSISETLEKTEPKEIVYMLSNF